MKQFFCTAFILSMFQYLSMAQLTTLPDGGNKRAMVAERVGLTDITIVYNRPGVKGREGKIWGELVPYGYTYQGFGTSKAAPWRAGANEGTTMEFSTDVTINGKNLAAGKYGFFIAMEKDSSTLIFSKNNTAWGAFFYDPTEDALRVTCRQVAVEQPQEFLLYSFRDQTINSAVIALSWEKMMFPFKVETDVNKNQLAFFRKELQTEKGFSSQAFVQAATWCADNNINLEEALKWSDAGISEKYIGERNFRTLSTKARILDLMGKQQEAAALMKEAVSLGSAMEVHGYARYLQSTKKNSEAAEVFRANYKKYPNTFTTNVGMVRALSSEGKFKEALTYATAAQAQAPDEQNMTSVATMIEKLKSGKDVN